MIRSLFVAATVLMGVAASGVAHADTLAGRCYAAEAKNLDGKVVRGHTLKCAKGTWSQLGSGADTSDVNAFVTVYNWNGTSKDKQVTMLFRPRKSSECLVAVTQQSDYTGLFTGKVCDTDYKAEMPGINILSESGTYAALAVLSTSSKQHNFASVYKRGSDLGKPGDSTFYLVGVFVEDK